VLSNLQDICSNEREAKLDGCSNSHGVKKAIIKNIKEILFCGLCLHYSGHYLLQWMFFISLEGQLLESVMCKNSYGGLVVVSVLLNAFAVKEV